MTKSIFWIDVTSQIVAPCGVNDFVCGRAAEWVSNGTDLCLAAGFRVKPFDNAYVSTQETSCYGDITSLDSVADSWKTSQFGGTQRGNRVRVFEDFPQWVRQMPSSERISWAIGGMVLTAGLVFMRSEYCLRPCLHDSVWIFIYFFHTYVCIVHSLRLLLFLESYLFSTHIHTLIMQQKAEP